MPKFQIEQTATAVILWEGNHDTAKEAIAALEAMAGAPECGWEDSVTITETWLDVNGAENSRTMTVTEALAS